MTRAKPKKPAPRPATRVVRKRAKLEQLAADRIPPAYLAALDDQVEAGLARERIFDKGADRDHRVNACAIRLGPGLWCGIDRDHAGDHRDVTAGPSA